MNESALKRLEQEMTPQRFVLENGLTVLVCEMPQFKGVHAVYATRFGSATRSFELDGETITLPDGVAHFLEHKMFEDEDGNDAFELYAQTGASANAFTSFDKTCYIFTATAAVDESLDILLDFVSHPYFTEKTVAKEQGIIGQEIKMYDDSPEFRMMFGTAVLVLRCILLPAEYGAQCCGQHHRAAGAGCLCPGGYPCQPPYGAPYRTGGAC